MKIWKQLSKILQAALIAFAVQMRYIPIVDRVDYESWVDYFFAQIKGLPGEYSFSWLLCFVLALCFICYMREKGYERFYNKGILPYFFSFCLLIGQSYAQEGNWSCCFGDIFHVCVFFLQFVGYSILFCYLIFLFLYLYKKAAVSKWMPVKIEAFFGEYCFRNVFILLLLAWSPVIILSYPGNVCFDFQWQMSQMLGMAGYFNNQQPMLHTLIAGVIVRCCRKFIGSVDVGVFLYTVLQAIALATALAGTVSRLTKRAVACVIRVIVVSIYVFAPMYSNMVSTPIKDVPFMAAFLWYILLLDEMIAEKMVDKKNGYYWFRLILAEVLVGLLRNNGVYVVVLTGIVLLFVCRRRIILLCTVIVPLVICVGSSTAMTWGLSAEPINFGKTLSIPFQQTARYVKLYKNELTVEEREAIEGVLTDVNLVSENYDPDISDPICTLYLRDSGVKEHVDYFRVWAIDFFKHPAVYVEAFFVHVYGWFDPGVKNAIRYGYNTDMDWFQRGLIPGADEMLRLFYEFVEYIPFLAILENAGIYTWMLFMLGKIAISGKIKKGILLTPLFVSLLICMASPCFYGHPRYAFPIMFSIPFLYGLMSRDFVEDISQAENMGKA